jgi:two-component system, sensor histidine kinase and response regulator
VANAIAAPVMGCAVAGMHYTAMKAAVFLPDGVASAPAGILPPVLLASLIAFIALLIGGVAIAGSVAGRQSELAAGLRVEIAERRRAEAELVRAREEAEAANRAKSQFLATMSHEIRTPMNGVLGMASLLAATALDDRQRRLVDNVSRSGQALLAIINDILDFAKIESGKFEISTVPFELRETIAEMAELFSGRCGSKGLEFIYFVDEDVPASLVGDPTRLRQVLVNLVGNSVKFTEHGEILVAVSLVTKDDDAIVINFAVEDTGIGIPAEQRERIFEPFHQVDGSLTRARGGSGLGLAITRQLVELMDGTITLDSAPDRGSRFSFTARFKPSPQSDETSCGPRHLARPLRALVLDANAVSGYVMSLYLAGWQVASTVAASLAGAKMAWDEAIEAGRRFDVVILDIRSLEPEMLAFAALVRGAAEPWRSELILLTALDTYMVDEGLAEFDAAAILPKPVRPSELFGALVTISHDGQKPARADQAKQRRPHVGFPVFGARILVAEDNPVNQDVASGILELMGCRTVSAPNGRDALRLFAQEKFDAILMDCEMPVMDGIEATRRIRELEAMTPAPPDSDPGAHHRIPIIASTAHAINEVRDRCLAVGMDDFLVKPFDERQMAAALSRWLKPCDAANEPGLPHKDDAAPAADDAVAPARDEVIDGAVIDGLRALARPGKPSPLARALDRFLETTPAIVASIRAHADCGDAEALWRAAHSLKSSAGALGAKQLSVRCAEIELRARDDGIEAALPLVEFLDDDLGAAIAGLKTMADQVHEPA